MPRGTLETEFVHKPFDELRRLGLHARDGSARARRVPEADRAARRRAGAFRSRPHRTSSSRATSLVEVDGKLIAEFVPLAVQLDAAVGKEVKVVDRARRHADRAHAARRRPARRSRPPNTSSTATACSTSCRISKRGTSIAPMQGVYVANPGYVFGKAQIPRGSIVTGIGSTPINDLDDLRARARSDARLEPRVRALRDASTSRRASGSAIINERPQLVPGAALPPRRHARRMAVPGARGGAAERADAAERGHDVPAPRREARAGDLAVARARELRHAVHRVRRRGSLLLRHRARRRRRARLGRRRPQHRAGRDGRRAAHVRGLARDPGARRVHPPAAQPRRRVVRPEADRQHAREGRHVRHEEPRGRARTSPSWASGPTSRCWRSRARSRTWPPRCSRCRARCASARRTSTSRRS